MNDNSMNDSNMNDSNMNDSNMNDSNISGNCMNDSRFERIVFVLLKVFGILTILGAFLDKEGFFSNEPFLVYRNHTIIGNVFMISPRVFVEMIVSILLYLVFIGILSRHIRISRRNA